MTRGPAKGMRICPEDGDVLGFWAILLRKTRNTGRKVGKQAQMIPTFASMTLHMMALREVPILCLKNGLYGFGMFSYCARLYLHVKSSCFKVPTLYVRTMLIALMLEKGEPGV